MADESDEAILARLQAEAEACPVTASPSDGSVTSAGPAMWFGRRLTNEERRLYWAWFRSQYTD